MSISNKLDPEPLVTQLLAKTTEGKLRWEPTADRRTFVASVGGNMSFRIELVSGMEEDDIGQLHTVDVPVLKILDEKGNVLWDIYPEYIQRGQLRTLYAAARRVGNRLDERLDQALSALRDL